MRDENFSQKASNDLCVLYPDDFTSIGTILFPRESKKSTS